MDTNDFSKGALLGAVTGILAGVLLAPKSGKETREDISNLFDEMSEAIADKIDKVKDLTEEKYQQVIGSVISGYETAKKITPEEAMEIKGILEDGFEKIQKSATKKINKGKEKR